MRALFAMIALLAVASGCQSPGPVTVVDARTWQPTVSPAATANTQTLEVTVLGITVPRPEVVAALRKALRNAQQEPLETRALTFANVGIAATHMGALDLAANALDGALLIMDAVIYDPAKSHEIARLSGEERTKVFKGEPHERALCNLYRGIVYLADGEFESARACFLRADMYRSPTASAAGSGGSWLSLEYLAAFADSLCPTQIGVQWPSQVPEGLELDSYSPPEEDVIVVVMSGLCPAKQHRHGGTEHGLGYGRIRSQVSSIEIGPRSPEVLPTDDETASTDVAYTSPEQVLATSAPSRVPIVKLARPTEDIFLQAVSNGRREVDKLLAAKQQAAQAGADVADASEILAAVTMGIPYAGYAFFLITSLSRAGSADTDSTADLRSINGPGFIYIATIDSSSGPFTIRALTDAGSLLGEVPLSLHKAGSGKLKVIIARVYQ